MDVSVVIPVYNEASRIASTIRAITDFFSSKMIEFEVIVSDNQSSDGTSEIVQGVSAKDKRIKLVCAAIYGKGGAVRTGVMHSKGDIVLFTDADLSTPIQEFDKLSIALAQGYDIAIASRRIAGAKIIKPQPISRVFFGKAINLIIRALYLPGIYDTQCGFKAFKGAVARELFARQKIDGFLFDVEILYRAKKTGYRIKEVPVTWSHGEGSKVSILRDFWRVLTELLRIKLIHR